MIKHIVMWKLLDKANGKSRQENARLIKQRLEALNGTLPGLLLIEVGVHVPDSEAGADDMDIILYSEFADMQALEFYYAHPDHVAIKPLVKEARSERRLINYEI